MSTKDSARKLAAALPLRRTGQLLIVLAGLLISQAFAALAQILLARRVDALDYGLYLASVSLVTVLAPLMSLGLDQWLLIDTSETREGLARSFFSALRVRIPFIVGWLLALALLSATLPTTTFPPSYLLLAAISIASDSTSLLAYSALRNRGLHRRVTLLQSVAAALVLAFAFALPLAPGRADLFLAMRALVSVLLAVCSTLSVRSVIGGSPGNLVRPSKIVAGAWPFMLSESAVAIYMRADLVILSLSKGAQAASVYGPATSLLSMCFLVPNALYLLVLPGLARLNKTDCSRYHRFGFAQLVVQGVSGMLLFVAVFVFTPWLMNAVFGPSFAEAAGVLRLLSPILLFKSLSFGIGAMLTSQGKQGMRTWAQVGVAILSVLANLAVVGRFGIIGVALVYVLSEIVLCLTYTAALLRGRNTDLVYADEQLSV